MHFIVMLAIFCVMVLDFLAARAGAPALLKFVPELLSGVIMVYVLFEGVRQGFRNIGVKYWAVFGALAFVIVCGILTNGVGAGPTLAGIRAYLRAAPLFFLPAVFDFTDKQRLQQMKFLLLLGLVQLPLTIYQRYVVWSEDRFSGDSVSGTVLHSGTLSLLLICFVLVLAAFAQRKQIGRILFVVLFFALLIPTTINETKATVLLLPAGLLTTLILGSPPGKRLRVAAWAVLLLVAFGSVLIPVYDFTEEKNPYKRELISFFTDQKQIGGYMEAKHASVGTNQQVGRGDAITIPAQYLARDPVKLAFGLGLGNATHSNFGQAFVGEYFDVFQMFVITSFTVFLLEIGVFGTLLVFILYWLVFSDAIAVAKRDDGQIGCIAMGWAGVVVVMGISTFYMPTHFFNSLSYLYWYFSGTIAARRQQLLAEERSKISRVRAAAPVVLTRVRH